MLPNYTSFSKILETTNRIPFTNSDGEVLIVYLKKVAKNGLDVAVHPIMKGSVKEGFADGVVILTSATLDTDFVFVKIDGGRGLFGNQKSNILCFVGGINRDELMPGSSFRSFAMALTSINNIFRAAGLLHGPAL